ncbi:hypothetical protein F4779DRAFT_634214 [Xylariaceae sp. FL0662B]|nr:hypothetical protein F4779DRAFT_634214 [Xylariaceae sp. FL0662B]
MPISPETRRIADGEWQNRKGRILELYITLGRKLEGPDGVIPTMANEGFNATVPQYEHRFRKWGVRKNRKRAEWERIIHGTQQGGGTTQFNQTISSPKLQRARRRYASRMHQGAQSVSSDYDNTTQAEGGHMTVDAVDGIASTRDTQPLTSSNDYSDVVNGDVNMNTIDLDDCVYEPNHHTPPPSGYLAPAISFTPDLSFEEVPFRQSSWLQSLPSAQLVATAIKRIYSNRLTTSTFGSLRNTGDSDLLGKFFDTVNQPVPFSRRLIDPPVPNSLWALKDFAGENWGRFGELSGDAAREACFDGRLIMSVINTFAGLKRIPAAGVLKFLDRHLFTQLAVINFLKTDSSAVAKSFVENIFVAYLEADNVHVVQYLLGHGLIDANKAVCHCYGERYTPLEIAAIKQSFKVLGLLISRKVDVNKSFSKGYRSNGPLHLLIQNMGRCRSALDDSFLSLIDAFLEAEATIPVVTIQAALLFNDPRLAIRLLENLASQTPQKLISHESLLQDIIVGLNSQNATRIIELIINKCRESGRARYLYQFPLHVNKALDHVVWLGHDKLAGILLPYASSSGTAKALQTAMEAGNLAIVELILKNGPDLAEDLDRDTQDSEAFICALKSGDRNHLRSLEKRGVFNYLQGHEIGRALTSALRTGNLEYATKILDLDPDFRSYHDRRNKPEFVKAIIEAGFDPNLLRGSPSKKWPILQVALEYGEDSIFDDIWNVRPNPIHPTRELLELALEHGGKGLFLDIVRSSPQEHDPWGKMSLRVAVQYENESVLDELISLGARADDDDILEMAVDYYPSMARPLLDRYQKTYPQGRIGYGRNVVSNALRKYWKSPGFLDMAFAWKLISLNTCFQEYPWQETLLSEAIRTHDCNLVKKFIDAGSDVNAIMKERYSLNAHVRTTALLIAIEIGKIEIVQLLIGHGAKVNEPARFGIPRTPLQRAAEMNNIPIVRLLLESGANVNAKPAMFAGATALQFAAIEGNCEMAAILIEHRAQQDIPPPRGIRGRWPLEGAAENGRFDMLELLWNAHYGPLDEKLCQSAMRLAERNGHFGCKEKITELMARSAMYSNTSLPTASPADCVPPMLGS